MNSILRTTRVLTHLFLVITLLCVQFTWLYSQENISRGRSAVSKEAMATTAHPLATEAAIEMLKKGGNAVDAAVAAAFAIGVVEPDGSGLGGGGGMVIYLAKEQKSVYINYYQRASEKVDDISYAPADNRTPKAILVPGTVSGLTLALERYGTLPLATVLEPAIRHAEMGFPVDETLAKIILDNTDFLQKQPEITRTFLRDGFPLMQGDTLRQPELANTLRIISEKGKSGFYEGPVAELIVNETVKEGGMLTLNDMKNYNAVVTEPLHGTYRGYDIITANAPQSGSTVLEGLNILENVPLAKLGHYANSVETMHLMAETMRRVYADRSAFLDDPAFEYVPVKGLISKAFALTRYNDIDRNSANPTDYRKTKAGNPLSFEDSREQKRTSATEKKLEKNYQWGDEDEEGVSTYTRQTDDLFNRWGSRKKRNQDHDDLSDSPADSGDEDDKVIMEEKEEQPEPPEGGHTTHLSVIDKQGNAVSLTQTLGTFFGSGLSVDGVILNCSMANFSLTTAVNAVKSDKQPRSSIAPTIILKNGKPYFTVGSPGATRIIATVMELIVNVIDFGMSVEEANNAPRFLCQKNDDYLSLESRISETVQEGLQKKGHRLKLYGDLDLFFGGAQMILYDQNTGTFYGSADPRRGGVAIGD